MGITKYIAAFTWLVTTAVSSPVAPPPAYGAPNSYGNTTSISPNPKNGHWVDTWTSMPQLTEFANLPSPPFVSARSVPITIHHTYHYPPRTPPTLSSTTPPSAKLCASHFPPSRSHQRFRPERPPHHPRYRRPPHRGSRAKPHGSLSDQHHDHPDSDLQRQ